MGKQKNLENLITSGTLGISRVKNYLNQNLDIPKIGGEAMSQSINPTDRNEYSRKINEKRGIVNSVIKVFRVKLV